MSESLEHTKDIDAVDANGWTALHLVACKGDVDEVERLLAAGANVDARTTTNFGQRSARNSTPLIMAARFYHFDVMRLLLDRGADIDACDNEGYGNEALCLFPIMPRSRTALSHAVIFGSSKSSKSVEFLIWKGANANIMSANG